MGINIASLLNEKRIKVACQRLMDTDKYGNLTIEAVIADLGFKSRSTFSKTFKRITGLTPGEFQRLAKQKWGFIRVCCWMVSFVTLHVAVMSLRHE